eukprot:5310837-Prymnesium_polylepis.1
MPGLRLFCTIVGSLEGTGRLGRTHDAGNGVRKPDMCRAMPESSFCYTPVEFHWGGDAGRMRCYCPNVRSDGV